MTQGKLTPGGKTDTSGPKFQRSTVRKGSAPTFLPRYFQCVSTDGDDMELKSLMVWDQRGLMVCAQSGLTVWDQRGLTVWDQSSLKVWAQSGLRHNAFDCSRRFPGTKCLH